VAAELFDSISLIRTPMLATVIGTASGAPMLLHIQRPETGVVDVFASCTAQLFGQPASGAPVVSSTNVA
jgi:hypothetical protein